MRVFRKRLLLVVVLFCFLGFNFRQPPLDLAQARVAIAVRFDGGIYGVAYHHYEYCNQYQRRECKKILQLFPLIKVVFYSPVSRLWCVVVRAFAGAWSLG